MGPMNWVAIAVAAVVMAGLWLWRDRPRAPSDVPLAIGLSLLPALMLGHALARIGPEVLALKPKLYWMQSGGLAVAFVIPALVLSLRRHGTRWPLAMADAAFWLGVYLAMGTVFWALA